MRSKVVWLRTSYWAGAVADIGIGVLTLIPSRMGEAEFRYPMGLAAAVMFAWALLLIWADRRPLERRGVLLPTIFVILGLLSAGLFAVASGIFPITRIVPTSILGVALIALMGFSYRNARGAEETSA
jgi:drug/metabolite transporter (DMT)-like permease